MGSPRSGAAAGVAGRLVSEPDLYNRAFLLMLPGSGLVGTMPGVPAGRQVCVHKPECVCSSHVLGESSGLCCVLEDVLGAESLECSSVL